jgi:Rrf2 family protein
MLVSMRGDYGIRALIELALRYHQGPVQSSEIASRQNIPEPYLDQLLTTLRKAGFIHSTRGPQGGHVLARSPEEITLGEVILALEGTLSPIACLDNQVSCGQRTRCAQREVWVSLKEQTAELLNNTTIATLTTRERVLEARGMYYI